MSISGISSAISSTNAEPLEATQGQSKFKQMRNDFDTLSKALSTGDTSAAKDALTQLVSDLPNGGQNAPQKLKDALASIQQSLDSGDVSGAQKALSGLTQGKKAGHHHHRPHASADQAPVDASSITGIGAKLNIPA